MLRTALLACLLVVPTVDGAEPPATEPATTGPRDGRWHATLASPGGDLSFGLHLDRDDSGAPRWWVINGPERLPVPRTTLAANGLTLEFTHYDSAIRAAVSDDGRTLRGRWTKTKSADAVTTMAFRAEWLGPGGQDPDASARRADPAPTEAAASIDGRWSVRFSSADEPAVGIFRADPAGEVTGTFLTTTGDYRYLAGSIGAGSLRLSCFDGAHAFLFRATLRPDGTLAGDFWSRDAWHETWTARRDPDAALPDAFTLTRWKGDFDLDDLRFRDLDGRPRSPGDEAFRGRARIIQVFGSWCPNCHDATRYLVELDRRYGERGLSILGLAFELTGDFERDSGQVRRYLEQQGADWP
ncbi:MAG: TlpA disulfide reductase family protein, partial [Planctomycetota bacterium]